jgi:hypothetical protein
LDKQYIKKPSICLAWHAPWPDIRLKSSAEASAKFFLPMTRLALVGARCAMWQYLDWINPTHLFGCVAGLLLHVAGYCSAMRAKLLLLSHH